MQWPGDFYPQLPELKYVLHVNNALREDPIPGLRFDWWNFGDIARDVFLVKTPHTHIRDYTIQLCVNSFTEIGVYVYPEGPKGMEL